MITELNLHNVTTVNETTDKKNPANPTVAPEIEPEFGLPTDHFDPNVKASVLVEALPYIQKFAGKTIVIKYGGNAMINDELKTQVMQDIALMKCIGIRPVIVHGGGPDITDFLQKFGKESTFVSGLRVTDQETVTIAEMVLVGKLNSEIVNRLNKLGIPAVGLSGKDANLLWATKKLAEVHEDNGHSHLVDIGFVGEVQKVNTKIINDLLDNGYVPVISPIGTGKGESTYNITADYAAAEIAGALKATKLILLTNTKGVYKVFEDPSTFLSSLSGYEAAGMINKGQISGGMIPKVEASLHALKTGAGKVSIINGCEPHAIILELFTDNGIGTEINH